LTEFQSSAGWQGRQFAQQCDFLLTSNGFELQGRRVLPELGVEIDRVCESPEGRTIWTSGT
jgi:hypothetical protein